jgi:hypothetical protein
MFGRQTTQKLQQISSQPFVQPNNQLIGQTDFSPPNQGTDPSQAVMNHFNLTQSTNSNTNDSTNNSTNNWYDSLPALSGGTGNYLRQVGINSLIGLL